MPRKRTILCATIGVMAAMSLSIRLGELAARHVMRVSPPGALAATAEPQQVGALPNYAWTEPSGPYVLDPRPSLSLLPPVRVEAPRDGGSTADRAKADPLSTAPEAASFLAMPIERIVHVAKGDTLLDILVRAGVSTPEAHDAASAVATVFDPRNLKPGLELKLTFGPGSDGRLIRVSLPASYDKTVNVERDNNDGFKSERVVHPTSHEVVRATGSIHSSLYEDAVAAGVPAQLVVELIRAFSYDVDFQREIHEGDTFDVAFERDTDGIDKVLHVGNLVYGQLVLAGHRLRIYRFATRDGRVDYFNERGESVRKALLRTPVDGARLTSGFGMRVNPILGYSMMHKGVDFGAPAGTPIMAAGEGTVELAGWNGAYGNYVRIRHNGEYSTAYGHMSRIANGLRRGLHVRQGQVIGYIGATGRATGPHLHYEVLVHDHQINPTSVKLPTGIKLAGADLGAFRAAAARTDATLAKLPSADRIAHASF